MTLRDIFKFRDPPETETSKPFLEHLEDLRWTIVKMALTLGVAMIVCFAFRSTLVRVIQAPLNHLGSQVGTLKALGITDSIVISFHLAFYAGIVLSFPLLLYFLAEFVLPALTAVEKRFLFPAIAVSFALFLVGVLVCYFWLLPKTILFFFRDTESLGWAPTWTVQQYYSFVTRFIIGFGLAFELPVVVLALVRFGLITYRFMCTAHLAKTRWMHRLKRSAPFAISTRVAAPHRFYSRQQQLLSTKSLRSCKRFAILDQTSARSPVLTSKDRSFRKPKPEHNAPSLFRILHRPLCGSCSDTRTC